MSREGRLTQLQAAAAKAQAVYRWEDALDLYTQALELVGATREDATTRASASDELRYELLLGRAACHRQLGDYAASEVDLSEMARLAEAMGDLQRRAAALNQQAAVVGRGRDLARARELAQSALDLARQAGDGRLEADSQVQLGLWLETMGEIPAAQRHYEQALALARALDYAAGEASALRRLGGLAALRTGHPEQAGAYLQDARELYRLLGDRDGEADAVNGLGIANPDLARKRAFWHQALEIFSATGNRPFQAVMYNNLGDVYLQLGLYQRARGYSERAVQLDREVALRYSLAVHLATLAVIYLGLGRYKRAQEAVEEGRNAAQAVGSRLYEMAYPSLLLGMIALGDGRPEEARQHFQEAVDGFANLAMPGFQATSLAWLAASESAAERFGSDAARDKLDAAKTHSAQAVAIPETTSDFPAQHVWWWRYQVLRASGDPDRAWAALDRARELMLEGIATLGDEGLRRNYLNKVAINREIVLAWTRHAARSNLSLAPFLERHDAPGSLEDQFQRLVDTGTRLTALRDPEALTPFILDEFVELSGAERAFVLLFDGPASGDVEWACAMGVSDDEVDDTRAKAAPVVEQVLASWQPFLGETEHETAADEVPALRQRSLLGLPMITRGKMLGLLYGDMRHIFGRFSRADLDLLSLLANQAAAALENAEWSNTLERRVERRTAELSERNRQLAVVNAASKALANVGQDVAATLDLPTVLNRIACHARDLLQADVGVVYLPDELGETFQATVAVGAFADQVKSMPVTLGRGIIGDVAQRGTAEIVNETGQDPRVVAVPGTPGGVDSRLMAAPLLSGEQVRGIMAVWRLAERPPFKEEDLDFVTRLARQGAIAVENARLYEEAEEARTIAEAANEDKSAFLASVSHELRTPLTSVIGFARIIQKRLEDRVFPSVSEPDSQTKRAMRQVSGNIDIIIAEGQRLTTMINNLLDLAKIEAGRVEWQTEPILAAELIEQATASTAALFEGKALAFIDEIEPDLPELYGDRDRLLQVIINLISNAVKFTDNGSVTCRAFRSGDEVVISVIDTGVGIAEEDLTKVFERFKQVGDTLTGKPQGTGLGLPISKEIIEHHGGRIWAQSQPGRGSTFSFALPIRK